MNPNIFITTLRMNLSNEADRTAYEHLRNFDRGKFRSMSHMIITAVNEFYRTSRGDAAHGTMVFTGEVLQELRIIEQKQDAGMEELRLLLAAHEGAAFPLQIDSPTSPHLPPTEDVPPEPGDLTAALNFLDSF